MIQTAITQHVSPKPTPFRAGWPGIVALSIIILASLAVFFGQLGQVPLFNPDEGLYAEPAREMLDTGEYVTTLLNYVVRFTKPPLAIWLMALSYKIFGINEFAARFPGALAAVLLVVTTYQFLSSFLNRRTALIASMILVTSPMCIGVARTAITDMPLALFTAGGIFALYAAFEQRRKALLYVGYALIGLAVMTKGPVGALLPLLVLGSFHILAGTVRDAFKFFNIPLALLIIGAISLPWFVVEIYLTKGAYFQEFILRENFGRFTSVVDSHKGAWWYHLAAMFGGFFPWSLFLPQAIFLSMQQATGKLKEDPAALSAAMQERANNGAAEESKQTQRMQLFLLCWVFVTLVFFSISVSKLLTYTLPAFPALAALVAMELDGAIRRGQSRRLILPFCLIALSFALSATLAAYALNRMREAPLELTHIIASLGIWQACATLVSLALCAFGRRQQAVFAFIASFVVLLLYFGSQLLPELSKTFEGDTPAYARMAADSKIPFIVFDLRKPAIPFYTRRQVVQPADRTELDKILKNSSEALIITRHRDLAQFDQADGFTTMEQDARFAFLRWKAVR